jgi:hypothetical protein
MRILLLVASSDLHPSNQSIFMIGIPYGFHFANVFALCKSPVKVQAEILGIIFLKKLYIVSYTEFLERFQSKVLCMTVDAAWYVLNTVMRTDLQTSSVREEIHHYSSQYSARQGVHPNDLVVNFMT